MKENFIQLKNDDILRLKIKDVNGEYTGEILTFDLNDPDLFLNYQELLERDKKNRKNLQNQIIIIDKRQDVKGKKLLSKNEEDKTRAISEFFKEEEKIFDMFLGEGGTKKLLNGRKFGWLTIEEISDIIVKQIAPYLKQNAENITKRIKTLYGDSIKNKEEQELEIDDIDE